MMMIMMMTVMLMCQIYLLKFSAVIFLQCINCDKSFDVNFAHLFITTSSNVRHR